MPTNFVSFSSPSNISGAKIPGSNRDWFPHNFILNTGAFIAFSMPPKQAWEDAVAALSERLTAATTAWDQRLDSLAAVLSDVQLQLTSRPSPLPPSPTFSVASSPADPVPPLKPPKLLLPSFDGTAPLDWLFQADQFFSFYQVPPVQRLPMVSFYMQGEALSWFKWMHSNHQLSSWDAFVRALELRFGPSSFDNHQAALFKLRQRGSVADFQAEFERLCNRVVGLPPEAILNCFISGLRSDIQRELAVLQPSSISQAVGLAKLLEAKFLDARPSRVPAPPPSPRLPPLLPAPPPKAPLPIRRLSPTEMQHRRAQGLCFNCDEKFGPGHRCKANQFLLLLAEDEEPPDPPAGSSDNTVIDSLPPPPRFLSPDRPNDGMHFQLSSAAAVGSRSPRTLCLRGRIHEHLVTVLVDSGSSHNIVQPRVAAFLGLPITPMASFPVLVGNGEALHCSGVCHEVPLVVHSHRFLVSLYVIPIFGADVVLGIQWLGSLGPVLSDFSVPSMQFYLHGQLVTLTGSPAMTPQYASFSQLRRFLHTQAIDSLCLLSVHRPSLSNSPTSPSHPQSTISPECYSPDLFHILSTYQQVFSLPQGLPPSRSQDHRIHLLPNQPPINVRPYRYPHFQKVVMSEMIAEMLQAGVIQPSNSPFSSPVLLVKKKDGTWRFCVDYRGLNAVTIRDRFPIPTVDELLDELHGATIFSKLDLRAGYHQIRVAPEDIHKTAFRTVDGHFEFLVMPFGLTNAPSTFQAVMNDIFRPLLRRFVLVFFDDILIYSTSWDTHLLHLTQVLQVLATNSLFAKLAKCTFGVSSIDYLGHVISANGVAADPSKLRAIADWPTPQTITGLRAFLGLTGYYRRFVHQYASIAGPLTDVLKGPHFRWTPEATAAFAALKSALLSLPVLHLPDFSRPFDVTTDASQFAVGAVLSQQHHPIAFFSKKMSPRMQAASAYEREMYAITEAVRKWRQYLLGRKFHIYTDQKSLRGLITQTVQTPAQQRWLTKLLGFDFEIHYTPGRENRVADALSRYPSATALFFTAVSSSSPALLARLRDYFTHHPAGVSFISHLQQKPEGSLQFSSQHRLVFFKERLYIPDFDDIRPSLLNEFHSTPIGGHSGVRATLARLAASFYWPKMMFDVKQFIQQCAICQQSKYSTQRPMGTLQPLPIPRHVWEDISMDFITHLPASNGKTVIWVVVDRLSKYAHFVSLPTHFTRASLAASFSEAIYKLHGMPRTIVSDRDKVFISHFWSALFKLSGTTLMYSSAYHPQTDGQTEVLNRVLETFLRCFVSEMPHRWARFIHLAEFWYNSTHHSSIGMPPFQALYGRAPPTIVDYVEGESPIVTIDELLRQHKKVLATAKYHLARARHLMKLHADQHRREFEFNVGDWVLLRLQPYRQISVQSRPSQKLGRRFFGPFRILRRIGAVAYELALPAGAKIHPVFHISLLKPFRGDAPTCGTLPPEFLGPTPPRCPLRILRRRVGESPEDPLILVQWDDFDNSEPTWVPLSTLQSEFPEFDLGDKVDVDGAGIDTGLGHGKFEQQSNYAQDSTTSVEQPNPLETTRRSNRKKARPTRLQDYVM
ncbi:UNVERIFIED_CONTAM: Retrovirus-related Pol polyprotein from transposon.6 [Sesamum radiatum]|uniref:Retrovirus-related Pol polyprotein from transposon.6 n=1 Tax=Sesamum radiatum TaxID=300843 RepID=A0AAW2T4Z0_SESRA